MTIVRDRSVMPAGPDKVRLTCMKAIIAAAALCFTAMPVAAIDFVTSDELRSACAASIGSAAVRFCDGYLRAQIEARIALEAGGRAKKCVIAMNDAEIAAFRSYLLASLSPAGAAKAGAPAAAQGDITVAFDAMRLCPL